MTHPHKQSSSDAHCIVNGFTDLAFNPPDLFDFALLSITHVSSTFLTSTFFLSFCFASVNRLRYPE